MQELPNFLFKKYFVFVFFIFMYYFYKRFLLKIKLVLSLLIQWFLLTKVQKLVLLLFLFQGQVFLLPLLVLF